MTETQIGNINQYVSMTIDIELELSNVNIEDELYSPFPVADTAFDYLDSGTPTVDERVEPHEIKDQKI